MQFQLYKAPANQQWYWRLVAGNGQIIATGAEGYINRIDALHGMDLVRQNAASAAVLEQQASGSWVTLA